MISRRNFLRSLPFVPAAVRQMAKIALLTPAKLSPFIQTTRVTRCISPEYTAALEKIMAGGCSLTRATIQPLTPAMFEALSNHESKPHLSK